MSEQELQAIIDRLEAASAGPWVATGTSVTADGIRISQSEFRSLEQRQANAEFIAHAREDIQLLLKEVKDLKADKENLLDLLRRIARTGGWG